MQYSNLNGHLYSMKIIDSPACSFGFVTENEFHLLLVCPLYNRPRVTLQNAMGHIAPFTLRTLLYGDDNLDLSEKKENYNRNTQIYQWFQKICNTARTVMLVFWLCVFTIHCKYSICHLLSDVHLYKFFTFLDINKICLNHGGHYDLADLHYWWWEWRSVRGGVASWWAPSRPAVIPHTLLSINKLVSLGISTRKQMLIEVIFSWDQQDFKNFF